MRLALEMMAAHGVAPLVAQAVSHLPGRDGLALARSTQTLAAAGDRLATARAAVELVKAYDRVLEEHSARPAAPAGTTARARSTDTGGGVAREVQAPLSAGQRTRGIHKGDRKSTRLNSSHLGIS